MFCFRFVVFLSLLFTGTVASTFEDTTIDLGLSTVRGRLAAFGDFNSDSRTDFFFVEGSTIKILLAFSETFSLSEVEIDVATVDKDVKFISNVICADFNYDGSIDVAVMYQKSTSTLTHVWLYVMKEQKLESFGEVGSGFSDQVAAIDYDGDLIPDFYGEIDAASLPADSTARDVAWVRGFWVFNASSTSYNFVAHENAVAKLSSPHSNSYIDLDGDCLADMLLTSINPETKALQVEIWINKIDFFELDTTSFQIDPAILKNLGLFSFADVDADGDIDIIAPYCELNTKDNTCSVSSLMIFFNSQNPLENLGDESQICTAKKFSFSDSFSTVLDDSVLKGKRIIPYDPNDPEYRPAPTLQMGDFDSDGYPDIVTVMEFENRRREVVLFRNIECNFGSNECSRRNFEAITDTVLADVQNPLTATLFDISEKGDLDILTVCGVKNNNAVQYSLRATKILDEADSFFVKVVVLNGKCTSWCSDGPKFPDPEPRTIGLGSMIVAFFDDIYGNRQIRVGSLLPRSNFNALTPPYLIMGLGRTSNYIDTMSVTVPYTQNNKINAHSFQSVIPNSQLIIVPYSPSESSEWTMRLYLLPSNIVLWVALSSLCSCVVLALIVGMLHLKEKYEDDAEKKRTQHLFNYRAM